MRKYFKSTNRCWPDTLILEAITLFFSLISLDARAMQGKNKHMASQVQVFSATPNIWCTPWSRSGGIISMNTVPPICPYILPPFLLRRHVVIKDMRLFRWRGAINTATCRKGKHPEIFDMCMSGHELYRQRSFMTMTSYRFFVQSTTTEKQQQEFWRFGRVFESSVKSHDLTSFLTKIYCLFLVQKLIQSKLIIQPSNHPPSNNLWQINK